MIEPLEARQSEALRFLVLRQRALALLPPVDEQHGYLPGTLEQKMDPWIRPMKDSLFPKVKFETCPLAYMRGRTFDNAWIIGDEMQNSTPSQMKMFLTRIGEGSKMVVAGDPDQFDRGFVANGLVDLLEKLPAPNDHVQHIEFTNADVIRSEVIKEILKMYI